MKKQLKTNELTTLEGVLGLVEEAGEVAQLFKKHLLYGQPIDVIRIKEELGDLLFYLIYLSEVYHLSLDDIMDHNIKKLTQRYNKGS